MYKKVLNFLFGGWSLYFDGRRDGWNACEQLVYDRLKENYPNEYQIIWERLFR